MMRKWVVANAIVWLTAALICCAPLRASAQDQQTSKTPYTLPEYNAYQAAAGQTDPQAKVQALDDFVNKFPNSALMPLVDQQYYNAYNQTKNYPKLIEYVDKFLAVPEDKYLAIPGMTKERLVADRVSALYYRAVAFNQSFNDKDANAAQELTDARKYALQGIDTLNQIQKPANMTDETFAQQKKQPVMVFNYTAARAALLAKDYKDAIDSYNAYIAASGGPSQSVASVYYQIGVAYLQMVAQQMASQPQTGTTPPNGQPPATTNPPATSTTTPPATPGTSTTAPATTSTDNPQLTDLYMNGFWNLAKALSLNVSGEAQVKSYLRAQMFNYEQPACGDLLDQQMNDLIQQVATQTARPATYSIPSAADLGKILQSSNLLSILSDLQGGGDKGKMTWLAVCGQEIPNVVGKITDIAPATDSIDFKVFTAATGDEIQAGTTPNLDVTVYTSTPTAADTTAAAGANGQAQTQAQTPPPVQPEVSRFQKGDGIKFTGTLTKYDAQPFLLYFTKVQVDPSVIPQEKTARKPHRPGAR
jgi:tetratricopeptide (TPR) repeat protein